MATQSQGIQQLLAAEKKAADIVAEARKRKTKRLKQAKDEAMKEIEAYKAEREAAYKALEQQMLGTKSTTEDVVQQRTREQIVLMEQAYQENKQQALEDILAVFSKINPETHKNLFNQ